MPTNPPPEPAAPAGALGARPGRWRPYAYWGLGLGLISGYAAVAGHPWRSGALLHTMMETVATLLAMFVGIVAMVRYRSRPSNGSLFLSAAFLGTAFLDAHHTLVTSAWLWTAMPSAPSALIPWTWIGSRTFLAVMLLAWSLATRREYRLGDAGRIAAWPVVVAVVVFTLVSYFFFAYVPLPSLFFADDTPSIGPTICCRSRSSWRR